ncbi:hypothetical protein KIN20_030514 [Parelaphostrongylus tenuis]|uniref:Uncharacterized protein n=1 Tax=Parelaphostrongylus tenuis TaxID=148309 RepID=A0AAD5R3T5_PARTN|nr:hypothetical protein KIN20_030514 [Parelaphostrongylus tenuis]
MPVGQGSVRTFKVTGFTTLPVAMAYSSAPALRAKVPGIAADMGGAQAFISRLVMRAVFDVLESQDRSALLPNAISSDILGQLTVNLTYNPLPCQKIALDVTNDMTDMMNDKCIIARNTVTGI